MHPLTGPEHFEHGIKGKKRLQQVLLIPESMPIKHPLLWVFHWHKNVVDVHDHAGAERREDPSQ